MRIYQTQLSRGLFHAARLLSLAKTLQDAHDLHTLCDRRRYRRPAAKAEAPPENAEKKCVRPALQPRVA